MEANPLYDQIGPEGETCGSCVWCCRRAGEDIRRCRRHCEDEVDVAWPACAGWEGPLTCVDCGACCRSVTHIAAP